MSNIISVHKRSARYSIYLTAFILFFSYTLLPIIGSDLSRVPGNLGDARFNLYLLEHSYKYISGQESTFWNAGFFYPHQNVVAYSDNFLGSFMFYAPFRMVGLDRESAFQCWVILGFALNFAAMAIVLHRSRFGWLPVSLGAAVFTFAPVQIMHLGHAQLLYRMPIPLAWHFLDRFLDEYRPTSMALALGFLSWQFYMSPYLGYFLLILMGFYVCGVIIERNRFAILHYFDATSTRLRLYHAGWLLAFGFSLFPLYSHYTAPGIYRNTLSELIGFLPRPASYLIGSRDGLVEKILGTTIVVDSAFPWEHALFVGLVSWVAVLAVTVLSFRRTDFFGSKPRRVAFMFWGSFFLTLSIHGVSLYRLLLYGLPMLTGIRVVARIIHVLLLPFAYLTAVGIEWLTTNPFRRLPEKVAGLAALVVCLIFAWESKVQTVTTNKAEAQRRITTLERSLGLEGRRPKVYERGPVLAALWLNKSEPEYNTQLDAMLAAQDLNIVTVNGYSRFLAPGFRYIADCRALAEMLRDYEKLLPSFSANDVANRVYIAPGVVSCSGQFDARVSKSAGPLPDDAYTATIAPKCLLCPTTVGGVMEILVNVTNLSERSWPQDGIALSARFVQMADGVALSGFDNRFPLGTDFSPHQSKQYVVEVKAPARPGQYRLEVDLVQEMVAWFSQKHTKRGELSIAVDSVNALSSPAAPFSSVASRVAAGQVYDFRAGHFDSSAVSGFHAAEAWGMWSNTDPAEIRLPRLMRGPLSLIVVARSLVKNKNNVVRVALGRETQSVTLGAEFGRHVLHFSASSVADRIVFRGALPTPATAFGISDPRPMGFALARMEFRQE